MELRTGIKRSHYSVLPDRDSVSPGRSWNLFTGPLRLQKSTLIPFLVLSVSTVSGIGGYLAGKHSASGTGESLIRCKLLLLILSNFSPGVNGMSVNKVPVTFEYEFNFAEAPSGLTNQRWDSLFPLNGGFFQHPSAGPDPVAFSVFHQLHCLVSASKFYILTKNLQELALNFYK